MYATLALRNMLDVIEAAITASADDVLIVLFKEPVSLTPNMVPTDFVEADFSGYNAAIVTALGPAWDDEGGNAVQSFSAAHFQGTTGVVQNVIFGWYMQATVVATAPFQLIHAELFDSPIAVNGSMDAIDFVPLLKIGQPADV